MEFYLEQRDVYEFFKNTTFYLDPNIEGGDKLALYLQPSGAVISILPKIARIILEALQKHNGEYDLVIHLNSDYPPHVYPPIKASSEPFTPETIRDLIENWFS
jgi:hypothetical protein